MRLCILVASLVTVASVAACGPAADGRRPSVLLVVIDTLRADAVSAYGHVRGTTPYLDALAEVGVRYAHSYAPSPWTLPSHASLFTGLGIERHGVGVRGRMVLPDEAVTLAELLSEQGYETAGFAENALVSEHFNLTQGFDQFSSYPTREAFVAAHFGSAVHHDALAELDEWVAARDGDTPFFVFVNVFDPHEPYEVRDENRFLPVSASAADARRIVAGPHLPQRICGRLPSREELDVLHGLYLGEAAVSDRKVRRVRESLLELDPDLLTIVTADHGEHFGENRLVDHEFSVLDAVLHVPLIVQGLPGVAPAVIEAPVALAEVAASILTWVGASSPPAWGDPLPTTRGGAGSENAEARPLFGVYTDGPLRFPQLWAGKLNHKLRNSKRQGCTDRDRVFGPMVSITRYPFKLIWYERYSAQLFDLENDPGERFDLAAGREALAARLRAEAEQFVADAGVLETDVPESEELSPESAAALRALGYVD